MRPYPFLVLLPLLATLSRADADPGSLRNGTDHFLTGGTVVVQPDDPGDVFASGGSVLVQGHAKGNTHVTGFDVMVEAPVDGDLYAAGGHVEILAPVTQNITAMGFRVHTGEAGSATGNVRLMAASVVIDGAVGGALTVSADSVVLNAPVGGDALLSARQITFGPKARVAGQLDYETPAEMTIPATVLPATRIHHGRPDWADAPFDLPHPVLPGVLALFSVYLVSLAGLVAVAGLFLWLLPEPVEQMRQEVQVSPWRSFGWGGVALAAGLGLVPLLAVTNVGLPLVPLVGMILGTGLVLGYLLGVHALAIGLLAPAVAGPPVGFWPRLMFTAAGLVLVSLCNLLPVVGWLFNIVLTLIGLGGALRWAMRPKPGVLVTP